MNKKILVLTGPTASGKTKTAIALAKVNNAEIVCADSRIIYKDLDIVSAKPTPEEREGVEHHLIDIITPDEEFSAGDFVEKAKAAINEIYNNNRNVIITGGTWFYIKSLLDKNILPECKINHELRKELEKFDNISLWEKLNSLDSKRASLIHPNNKDKIIRSIEMCIELNMPISEYKRKENECFDVCYIMPDITREVLYERINKRVDEMVSLGLEEEWRRNSKKYPKSKVLYATIGYKEFFDKELYKDKEEIIKKIKQHTRNFAKRQLTYFRSNREIKLVKGFDDALKVMKEFYNV